MATRPPGEIYLAFRRIVTDVARKLVALSARKRTAIVVGIDLAALLASIPIAYALRVGMLVMPPERFAYVGTLAIGYWFVVGRLNGTYRLPVRHFGFSTFYVLARHALIVSILLSITLLAYSPYMTPRTMGVLQPLTMLVITYLTRAYLAGFLAELDADSTRKVRSVVVFGSGSAARTLVQALRFDHSYSVIALVDPEGTMAGRKIEGVRVLDLARAESEIAKQPIDELLIALDRPSRRQRRVAVDLVHRHWPRTKVRMLPSLGELASGRVNVSDLRSVQIEDLLGRAPVDPVPGLLSDIEGTTIVVTGAGGSIGSELCRQLIELSPAKIVLAERSEYHLYQIEGELLASLEKVGRDVEIVPCLIDLCDKGDVDKLFARHTPDLVYHAAAYKHVPLVEANPIAGIANNLVSTLNTVTAAEQHRVKRFTLVSTDKAVRPTNVMGASKRMCELVVQARARENNEMTCSAVRFGNVLGSSGSVVPKFRSQIAEGGPITLTHRDVTRFFMTIPEAALLVIQAGELADAGDVFLLDMGEPIRVHDMAVRMVELSGLKVRDDTHPDGDIEIVETGLRPGEKLFEELLIDATAQPTEHPRIVRARETAHDWSDLSPELDKLAACLSDHDVEGALAILAAHVSGYEPGAATA